MAIVNSDSLESEYLKSLIPLYPDANEERKSSRRVTIESNDREQRGKGILHKTPRMPMPGEPWDEPVLNFVTL